MLAREELLAQVYTLAATTSTDGLEEIVQHLKSLNQPIPFVTEEEERRLERSFQDIKEGRTYSLDEVKTYMANWRAQKVVK